MACRGVIFTSPADAVRVCPDLFTAADGSPSVEAAKKALQRAPEALISGTFPYDYLFIRRCPRNTPSKATYRPQGRGQQTRVAWVRPDRLDDLREELEAVLGPRALFQLNGPPEEPPPDPDPLPAEAEPPGFWKVEVYEPAVSSGRGATMQSAGPIVFRPPAADSNTPLSREPKPPSPPRGAQP